MPDAFLRSRDAFLIDLDGTIADTSEIHAAAFREVFAPYGVAPDYEPGLSTRDAVLWFSAAAGLNFNERAVDELVARKREAASRGLARATEIPGARAFLATARAAGIRLALCTAAARASALVTLGALEIPVEWFELVVAVEDVSQPKPDPECFQLALGELGLRRDRALVFEDSDQGLKAAASAGLDALRVGEHGAPWPTLTSRLAA